jgi:hypothetical protein
MTKEQIKERIYMLKQFQTFPEQMTPENIDGRIEDLENILKNKSIKNLLKNVFKYFNLLRNKE